MLEFIFFHPQLRDQFLEFLQQHGIQSELSADDESYTVAFPDNLDDELLEQIETHYDELMDATRELTDSEEHQDPHSYQRASLLISLKSGARTYAHVDLRVMDRILQVINTDELNQLIESIVDAVESPDERSYCQRVRDGDTES